MPIYKALLKYGHSNFMFDIIEYCEANETIKREQYYLDNFDFDYNVLEKANSLLGYKHTSVTKDKLRKYQTNKKHSVKSLNKMRELCLCRAEIKLKFKALEREELNIKDANTINLQVKTRKKITGKIVVVTNTDTKISTEYISISEAATALNVTRFTLRSYIKNKNVLTILKRDLSGKGISKESFQIRLKEDN